MRLAGGLKVKLLVQRADKLVVAAGVDSRSDRGRTVRRQAQHQEMVYRGIIEDHRPFSQSSYALTSSPSLAS